MDVLEDQAWKVQVCRDAGSRVRSDAVGPQPLHSMVANPYSETPSGLECYYCSRMFMNSSGSGNSGPLQALYSPL